MSSLILRKHHRGLTLVELLVALAVLTVLLLPIISVWHTGLKVFTAQLAYTEAHQDARIILDLISQKIRQAKTLEIVHNPWETGGFMLRLTTVDNVEESYFKYHQGTDIWVVRNHGKPSQMLSDLKPTNLFQYLFIQKSGQAYPAQSVRSLQSGEYVEIILTVSPREQGGLPYEVRTVVRPRN